MTIVLNEQLASSGNIDDTKKDVTKLTELWTSPFIGAVVIIGLALLLQVKHIFDFEKLTDLLESEDHFVSTATILISKLLTKIYYGLIAVSLVASVVYTAFYTLMAIVALFVLVLESGVNVDGLLLFQTTFYVAAPVLSIYLWIRAMEPSDKQEAKTTKRVVNRLTHILYKDLSKWYNPAVAKNIAKMYTAGLNFPDDHKKSDFQKAIFKLSFYLIQHKKSTDLVEQTQAILLQKESVDIMASILNLIESDTLMNFVKTKKGAQSIQGFVYDLEKLTSTIITKSNEVKLIKQKMDESNLILDIQSLTQDNITNHLKT